MGGLLGLGHANGIDNRVLGAWHGLGDPGPERGAVKELKASGPGVGKIYASWFIKGA